MSFMELFTYQKGRLASCDCGKCGATNYWHEWTSEGQADDLKKSRCNECGSALNPDTYWESRSRNYYACRYSAPGYMDCTEFQYGTNLRKLEREVRNMYGE